MKLYVPEIGDRLKLTKDWAFKLYYEHRNTPLLKHFGFEYVWKSGNIKDANEPVILPVGTVLRVDRIYIRNGAQDYSSISFYAEGIRGNGGLDKPKNSRFWAKLLDCNNIEFEVEKLVSKDKPALRWGTVTDVSKISGMTGDEKTKTLENVEYKYGVPNTYDYTQPPLYWITLSYTANRTVNEVYGGFFNKRIYYTVKATNPKYTATTIDGIEIGSWKTLGTTKKYVKEHYNSIP
jgi:hypothetical protein